ncbi:MAG: hypothetical protein Q8R15_01890 [Candidatus Micrarchaeota archaeon]|nr:hypothetical protein [Candidatus Micrarchaeota archaeon]
METIKATIITCSNCGFDQFFDVSKKFKVCPSCSNTIVMRTLSGGELNDIKNNMKLAGIAGGDFAYSDYRTYSLTVEEIRELKKIAREKKKAIAAKAYKIHKGKKPMRLLTS